MGILELIAMTFTLICVYLTSKQNILCWGAGIIGVIAFFLIYLDEKLYFQTALQVIFFIQSIYGWLLWRKNSKDFDVKVITNIKLFKHLLIIILISLLVGFIMNHLNYGTLPYLDTLASGLALLGTYYLAKKYLQSWIIWMIVNIMLLSILTYQELYIIAILEVILFIISLNAYITWKKDLKTDYV